MNGEGQYVEEGNFLTRFYWVIFSPLKLYSAVAARPSWWQPYLWVSIISVINAAIFFPIQMAIMRLNPSNLPEETLQKTLEGMEKFHYLNFLSTPIVILIAALLFSLVGYILVSILAEKATFKKFFCIYLYASIVVTIGLLLSTMVVRVRGVDSIRSASDAKFSLGLGFLVPPEHRYLEAIFSTLDVFSIWFYILIAVGLMKVFQMTRRAAIVALIPIWLVNLVASLVGARFSKFF